MTEKIDAARETSPYEFLTGEHENRVKTETLYEPLRRIDLFENLSNTDVELIARLAHEFDVAADTSLMREGQDEVELVLVMSGSLRIEKNGEIIGRVPAGKYVGEIALLDGKSRLAGVIANEQSRLLVIQKHTFDHVLASSPGLKDTLLLGLCARIRRLQGESAI